jgi:hypothetical protein
MGSLIEAIICSTVLTPALSRSECGNPMRTASEQLLSPLPIIRAAPAREKSKFQQAGAPDPGATIARGRGQTPQRGDAR